MSKKFPWRLAILDKVAWKGHIIVKFPRDGAYPVEFDAIDANGDKVLDQYVFSRDLILGWTGVDVECS